MRIAFHTPLNPFDDHAVSGDRRMARQLAAVLGRLGHAVEPVPDARAYCREPELLDQRIEEAQARGAALASRWRETGAAPDLWFTYHSYYKAPDLLGPALSRAFGIPYLVAEASDSARRAQGPWARHVALSREAIAAADIHLCFTSRDRAGIAPLARRDAAILDLPPFIKTAPPAPRHAEDRADPVRLLTVAMMREGAKFESYRRLAAALARIDPRLWQLSVIGDGPMRAQVQALFAGLPEASIDWRGRLENPEVLAAMAAHDLFVWPGIGEAYGLVYLEAQAAGLPVLACDSGGVSATVLDGETALLVPESDEAALADALARLIADGALRRRMGASARAFVNAGRTTAGAATIIAAALAGLAPPVQAAQGTAA